jgi:hypothetical protein
MGHLFGHIKFADTKTKIYSVLKPLSQTLTRAKFLAFIPGSGNLEVPVHFSKAKQGYTFRKIEKDNWIV